MLEAGTVRGIARNGERIDNNVDESDSQDDYEDAEVNYDGEGKKYWIILVASSDTVLKMI